MPGGAKFVAITSLLCCVTLMADAPNWKPIMAGAQAYLEAGENDRALRMFESVKEEASRQSISDLDRATLCDALGAAYEAAGKLDEANTLFDQGLRLRLGSLHEPDQFLAVSLTNKSSVLWAMNKTGEAERYAVRAKAMWEQLGQTYRSEYATSLNNLAAIYRAQSKLREAVALMQLACEVYRRTLSPSDPHLLKARENLAIEYKELGEYGKVDELLQAALTASPASAAPPSEESGIKNILGELRVSQGRLPEARQLLTDAIAAESAANPPRKLQLAVEYGNLSGASRLLGEMRRAEEEARSALTFLEGMHGRADAERGAILNNLGMIAQANHQLPEAEHYYRAALELWQSSLGEPHPSLSGVYSNLASLYELRHDHAKAEKMLREALARDLRVLPRTHPVIARELNNLGSLEFGRKRYAEAEPLFREAVDTFRNALGPNHIDTALAEGNLAHTLWAMKRPQEASPLFTQSMHTLETSWGKDNPKLIAPLATYLRFLRATDQSAMAEQTETQLMHIKVRQVIAAEKPETRS